MALLEVHNLVKAFTAERAAVAGVSLAIDEGEIVCLLGPSGCGKTTLLRMIAGLETPDAGEVYFDGRNMAKVPPHRRDFGMMFQDFALFPHKNVFQNIAFGLQMHGRDAAAVTERVAQMLALVALEDYGERDVSLLSGGEQQRVALARSLAPDPRLLLLDEPLGSLDRALRERLMLDLRLILKDIGVTAIYVTHDQTEAFAIADRVAVMNAGRVEQLDVPEVVYDQPATPFVARFLGFHNLLPAVLETPDCVQTALGRFRIAGVDALQGQNVALLIRPEAATVADDDDSDAENRISGVVDSCSFRGRYYQIWLTAGDISLVFEMPKAPAARGETAHLAVAPQQLRLLPL